MDLVSLYEVPAKKKLSIDNAMPIDDAMKLYEIAEKKENNEVLPISYKTLACPCLFFSTH